MSFLRRIDPLGATVVPDLEDTNPTTFGACNDSKTVRGFWNKLLDYPAFQHWQAIMEQMQLTRRLSSG